ncbi:hypothetical protein J4E91_004346 [Alternaria rosae]|nr:hypothetical protein J4E91_004346 [Alternaria rosae]
MCHRQGRDQYPLGYVQIVYFKEESIINAVKLADEYPFGFVSTYTPTVFMECYGLMTRHQEVRYQKRTRDGESSHQKREQWLLCPGELPKPQGLETGNPARTTAVNHPDVLTKPMDTRADVHAFLSERSKVLDLRMSGLPHDTTQSELEGWFTRFGGRRIAFWTRKQQVAFP